MKKSLKKPNIKKNHLKNIIILVAIFVIATTFVMLKSIKENSPSARFIEEIPTTQTAYNLGIIVIASIIIIGIAIHYIIKFSEKALKKI